MTRALPLVLPMLFVMAAQAAPPSPPASAATSSAQAPAPDPMAYARGAKAWAETCARCHGMRDARQFTDREWPVITTHMRLRAGLDGQQVRDITLFLQGSN